MDRGIEGRLVQLDFSAAYDRVGHFGLLNKLRSIGVGGQLSIVSEFLSDTGGRLDTPFLHLFVCRSNREVALLLCYHFTTLSTSKCDISASVTCCLWEFFLGTYRWSLSTTVTRRDLKEYRRQ